MATVAEILVWQPALLEGLADELVAGRRQLVGLGEALADGRPPGAWVGDDAVAAARTHRVLEARLHDLVAEGAALARGIRQAAAGVLAAKHAVLDTVEEARGAGFHVDETSGEVLDPAVPVADPALADDRVRHRVELVARLAAAVRAADHADAMLSRLLGLVASSLIDGGNGSIVDALAAGRAAAPREVLPLPVLGDPGQVYGWWRGLPATDRRRYVRAFPELIGNTDGIPMARRDEANRLFLPEAMRDLQGQLRRSDVTHPLDRMRLGLPAPEVLRAKIADLEAIREAVRAPGTALLSLGIRGKRLVTTDIALGNVGRADTVTHVISGVGTKPGTRVDEKLRESRKLLAKQEELSEGEGSDATHAVIMSMGYEAPQLDINDLTDAERQLFRDRVAKEAAPGTADFLNSIDTTRHADPLLTVDGHSYGALVAGETVQNGTGVDALVASGAPGTGVDDIDDLLVPTGNVYNLEARHDVIADSGFFGRDLTYLDGVRELDTAGHADRGLAAISGHTSYHDDGTTSQYNIAAVGSGHPELAIDDTRGPDFTDTTREGVRRFWDGSKEVVEETRGFLEDRVDDGRRLLNGVRNIL